MFFAYFFLTLCRCLGNRHKFGKRLALILAKDLNDSVR